MKKINHHLGNTSVKMQKKNLQEFKDNVTYGQRRILESVFYCINRIFGYYVIVIG